MADDLYVPGNDKFQIEESNDELTIQFRWFKWMYIALVFFCVIWDGFLFFWYSIAFGSGMGGAGSMMTLFPLIHVGVGIGLTYYTICGFVNKTVISVREGKLKIKSSPMPWPGANKNISVDDIKQLYVKETVNRGKNGSTTYSYSLRYHSTGKRDKLLVSGYILNSAEDAMYLEKKIEQFLGIADMPVQGEYGGLQKAQNMVMEDIVSKKTPRKLKLETDPTNLAAHDLLRDFIFDYDFKSWHVQDELQFDWDGGFSDRQLSATGNDGKTYLYLSYEPGHQVVIVEESENPLRWDESILKILKSGEAPPLHLERGHVKYFRERAYKGNRFVMTSHNAKPFPVEAWVYENDARNEFLRVEFHDGYDLRGFHGKLVESYKISNILPGSN